LAPAAAPEVDSTHLTQKIVLEAARQDIINQQVNQLILRFEYLQRDLASNGELAQDAIGVVTKYQSRLELLRNTELHLARHHLRMALRDDQQARHLAVARRYIDRAMRELASLLLEAGTSHALQAFAGQLDDVVDRVAQLRSSAIRYARMKKEEARRPGQNLATEQRRVSDMLDRFLAKVGNMQEVTTDALAAVRLARVRKELESAQVVSLLENAADQLDQTRLTEAAASQGQAIRGLLDAIDRLRPDARLETLVRLRSHIRQLQEDQRNLRRTIEELDDQAYASRKEEFSRRQASMTEELTQLSSAPELDDLRREARGRIEEAASLLEQGDRDEAYQSQQELDVTFEKMVDLLEERIADYQQLQDAYRDLQNAGRRLRRIRDMYNRQADLINEVDALVGKGEKVDHFSGAQESLDNERRRFIEEIQGEDLWRKTLQRPLKRAQRPMEKGRGLLEVNKGGEASTELAAALNMIEEAERVADRELAHLEVIWTRSQLVRDLRLMTHHIEDLQAEQADLATLVEQMGQEGKSVLDAVSTQEVLTKGLGELEEMLDMVPEAAAVTIPLFDARTAMSEATSALQEDNAKRAAPQLKAAAQALGQAVDTAKQEVKRTEYLIEMAKDFHQYSAMAANLLQRQIDLRRSTEVAEAESFDAHAEEQDVLRGEAQTFGDMLPVAAAHYQKAADEMGKAIEQLYLANAEPKLRDQAVVHQKKAEDALKQATLEIWTWLESLEEMMDEMTLDPMEWPSGMDPISKVLLLSILESEIRMTMMGVPEANIEQFVDRQDEILKQTIEVQQLIEEMDLALLDTGKQAFASAEQRMNDAMIAMKKPDKVEAIEHTRQAERSLRQALAELIVFTFPVPPDEDEELEELEEGEEPPLSEPPPPMNPQGGDWSVFLKATPRGKVPEKNRAEWQELTEREREALHENFARELPLEYRQLLRDYYKALSSQ
jgi:hypothetical protein